MARFNPAQYLHDLRPLLAHLEDLDVASVTFETGHHTLPGCGPDSPSSRVESLHARISVYTTSDATLLARRLNLGTPTVEPARHGFVTMTWTGWIHTDTPTAAVTSVWLLAVCDDITAAPARAGVA